MSESARERSWHQAGFPSPQSKVKKSMPSESVTECEMEDRILALPLHPWEILIEHRVNALKEYSLPWRQSPRSDFIFKCLK